MAEGLANHLGRGRVEAFSAGVAPAARVMPGAVAAMREVGVDISAARPKHADTFVGEAFDFIITLCDNARESCPYFPGKAARLHWPIADPYGPDLEPYRKAREEIRERLEVLFKEAARL
jgi:arsenate reductase